MTARRPTTHAELKAKRLAGRKREQEHVEIPEAMKWIGGLVIVITSFFAAVLLVLVAYQVFGVEASSAAAGAGRLAILALGTIFSVAGIVIVAKKASSASTWLGQHLVNLGIGPEGKSSQGRTSVGTRRKPPPGGHR